MTTIGDRSGASLGGLSPEMALLTLQASSRDARTKDAVSEIELGHEQLTRARAEIREAIQRAREAQEDAGIFADIASVLGDDIAPIMEVVAAGAMIAASGGSAAPIVIAAGAMTMAARVGAEQGMDPKLTAALALSGAALGLGANAAVSAAAAGTQAAAGTAAAGTSLAATCKAVAGGARVAEGAATTGAAVAKHLENERRADGLHADADRRLATIGESEAEERAEQGIDRLRRLSRESSRSTAAVLEIQSARQTANQQILSRIGGV